MKTESYNEIATGYVDLVGFFRRARKGNKRKYSIPRQPVALGPGGVSI